MQLAQELQALHSIAPSSFVLYEPLSIEELQSPQLKRTSSYSEDIICRGDLIANIKPPSSPALLLESYNAPIYYLPPIRLQLSFPSAYPSHSPPIINELKCDWLFILEKGKLLRKLQSYWNNSEVLFDWLQFLELQAFECLSLGIFHEKENIRLILPDTDIPINFKQVANQKQIISQKCKGEEVTKEEEQKKQLKMSMLSKDQRIEEMLEFNYENFKNEFDWGGKKMCDICCADKLANTFIILRNCLHSFCKECLNAMCEQVLMKRNFQKLACPFCNQTIGEKKLREEIFTEKQWQLYEKISIELAMNQGGLALSYMWCPGVDCDQLLEVDQQNYLGYCEKCGTKYCILCKKLYHPGKRCPSTYLGKIITSKVMNYYERVEALNQKFLAQCTKQCPACGAPVHKSGGCNRVFCPSCSHYFCWRCYQKDIEYNHFSTSGKNWCASNLYDQSTNHDSLVLEAQEFEQENPLDSFEQKNQKVLSEIKCANCSKVIRKQGESNLLECNHCKSHTCFQCGVSIKDGVTHFGIYPCAAVESWKETLANAQLINC